MSKQPRFDPDSPNAHGWLSLFFRRQHLRQPKKDSTDMRDYDDWLLQFIEHEPHLAGIVASVVSKDKNRAWTLTGGMRNVRRYSDIFHNSEGGAGWRTYISKQSRAFYNTNIGAITEIETVTGEPGDPLANLYHVDPARVQLLYDYERPLRYWPLIGAPQRWYREDFLRVASMPDVREEWLEIGYCAVDRALTLAQMLAAVYEHDLEQLGAKPPAGFVVGSGITQHDWDEAMRIREEAKRNGDTTFTLDVLRLLGQQEGDKTDLKFIPFSTLPANFDLTEFTYLVMQGFALAFGYDLQEFYLPHQGSFGRGTEAAIQAEKTTYKGDADFSIQHQEAVQGLLPDALLFEYDRNDFRGDKLEVEAQKARADLIRDLYTPPAMGQAGIIDRAEAREMLVEAGVLPVEWLERSIEEAESDLQAEDAADPVEGADQGEMPDMDEEEQPAKRALRRQYRDHDLVIRQAQTYPTEPIVHYRYDPMRSTQRVIRLWDSGEQLLNRHRVWGITRRKSKPKPTPTRYSDPILDALLGEHEGGCTCAACSLPNHSGAQRTSTSLIQREAQPGEVVYEDDDGDVVITEGDIDLALEEALERVGQDFYDLLTATLWEDVEAERSTNVTRDAYWDASIGRYRNESGRLVSRDTVVNLTRESIDSASGQFNDIAARLADGTLRTDEGMVAIREELKREYIRQSVAGRGGRDQMTPSDWGRVGSQLRNQYDFLRNFMDDIDSKNLTEGQINARIAMYFESSKQAFEATSASARGISARDLPALPGDGSTPCLTRCRCYWDYEAEEYNSAGEVIAWLVTWVRTADESCEDCIARASDWVDIRIAVAA